MQRHFSNRGEALAEVTAARMLASRGRSKQSRSIAQLGRQAKPQEWFTKRLETTLKPKRKQPTRDVGIPPLL